MRWSGAGSCCRTNLNAQPELVLAVVDIGVVLAALNLTQISSLRREIAAVRNEISNLRQRLAHEEIKLDVIRAGMQLPRPSAEPESEDQAA